MSSQLWRTRESFGSRLCASFEPGQLLRSEKWLCVACLVIASSYYAWTFTDPTPLAGHAWQSRDLFGVYCLYSLFVLVLLYLRQVDSFFRVASLAIDLVFVGAATLLSGGL